MTRKMTGRKRSPKEEPLLAQTRKLMRRYDLRARKRLGQHFLVDEEVLRQIISAAALTPKDTVLEIGPGLGILTGELARQAGRVIAVELDDQLAAILKRSLAHFANVSVINENILHINPASLLVEQNTGSSQAAGSYKVVANLPYYITSPVLHHFLQASARPQTMIVMVQKEVAEAIVSGPGQRSVLSTAVQFYGNPKIVGYVPAHSFYPPPEVDSAILRIDVYARPAVTIADEGGFFELVRAGFTSPRKQMVNSFARGLGMNKTDVLALLERADIEPKRRAETLTLEEWAQLWQVFDRDRKGQ